MGQTQHILGVKVDIINKKEALEQVSLFLSDGTPHTIFTPNPEMLVAAHKDQYLKKILNESSLNICDGKGIELLSRLDTERRRPSASVERIPGIDFMRNICQLVADTNKRVYLLGSGDEKVIKRAAETLQKQYSTLKIVGYHHGPRITKIGYSDDNEAVIHHIIMQAPDIVFVGFGHGKQEKWIYEHLPHLPSVKIAMGVGGAFDILGGKFTRAPVWMRQIWLEWLWRLLQEPKRIKRVWTAVAVFPYLVLKEKIDFF